MSASHERVVEALRTSLKERERLRQENQALLARSSEPLAVVGMACRLPGGADSADALWGLLDAGRDAVGEFPADRGWDLESLFDPDPAHAGTTYCRRGGFVYDAAEFDAEFFGISPREALAMDPQQRLVLEAAWEALEHAGIDPRSLRGGDTGVFCGFMYQGYAVEATLGRLARDDAEGYLVTGVNGGVVSGRIAYALGLEGPAVSLDTACSSSLVALHLACQSLRQGECSLALAGGVTVLATPAPFVEFSRQRALAPDGRCKAFAAAADGVGFAEGAGLVVLERLSDARRHGHPVRALVRGSAINQDGASNGLAAPNRASQERVIRQALASAGLAAAHVDAVEAHGTGTTLGDPIEAQALLATYGADRTGAPLRLGSIKSNLGHTQAAAGVAGVMKMVLALERERLPRTLHVDAPSPHVDWSAGAVELLVEGVPWPRGERARRAGVSSFGVSGTNAHLILEEPPASVGEARPAGREPAGAPVAVALSARDEPALRAQASRLHAHLAARPELALGDIGFSLATGRARLERRGAVVARDRDELLDGLGALARGEPSPDAVEGAASPGEVAFLFAGQGAQWEGMAVELLDSSPPFAESMRECEDALSRDVDWSLDDVLRGASGSPSLDRADVVQPASWAVMVSLAKLWRWHGVHPAVVVGHSQGEIAAAHVAGGLSLDDAARVVALRSRAIADRLAGRGGMMSVAQPAERLVPRLTRLRGRLSVAAVNGPRSTVVAGEPAALDELQVACQAEGVRTRRIPVDYASHSVHVEEVRERLLEELSSIAPRSGDLTFHSTATGERINTAQLDAEYWYRALRGSVRFEAATRALLEQGIRTFVEVSSHPVLTLAVEETAGALGIPVATIESLRRGEGGLRRFTTSLAAAYAHGAPVDWGRACAGRPARRVDLPTYPFQRRRYWMESGANAGNANGAGFAAPRHPVLGAAFELGDGAGWVFSGRLSRDAHPWLADHAVLDTELVPGAALVELALAAGARTGCPRLEELILERPLALDGTRGVHVQLMLGAPDDAGRRAVAVHARREDATGEGGWVRHAAGAVAPDAAEGPDEAASQEWPPADAEPIEVDHLYDRLAEAGFHYGPAFQGVSAAWRRGDELFAEVALDDASAGEAPGYEVHPALLDAALHVGLLGRLSSLALPFAWEGVHAHRSGPTELRVRLAPSGERGVAVSAFDADGTPALSLERLDTRPIDSRELAGLGRRRDSMFAVRWRREAPAAGSPRVAELDGDGDVARATGYDVAAWRAPVPEGVDRAAASHEAVRRTLATLQGWLSEERLADARLAVVTQGAVAVLDGEDVDPAAAAVWGLVRSAQSEHPGRFVLVDAAGEDVPWAALPAAGEPQLAVRGGTAHVPRLGRVVCDGEAPGLDGEGTVLVTGGTGVLGALLARHLAERHAVRHLLLVSRSGPGAAGAPELARALDGLGCEVESAACDVADAEALAALLDAIPSHRPLRAVVHAAGVLDDALIESLDARSLNAAMRPKVDAAWHLHELTKGADLAAFVLYSSAAGTLGAPGQANYAAANAFLDALAQHRRRLGLPATSLAWGRWEQASGLTRDLGEAGTARLARAGVQPLATADGLATFDAALRLDEAALVTARLDLAALRVQARVDALPPLLSELVPAPTRRGGGGGGALARRLAGLPRAEWDATILDEVRTHVAAVLGHPSADAVRPERTFKDLGFDSLAAVELRNRLAAATSLRLPATLVFDHPNAAAAAAFLRRRLEGAKTASAPVRANSRADGPVAIVGMGCRLPGAVTSPEALWELLTEGRDAISEFPADRGWELERLYDPDPDRPGTSYCRHGGFVSGAGEFDADFFGIGPREALAMDPQQRILLEVAWEALEHAGIDPSSLRGSRAGVFAGTMYHDYGLGHRGRDELEGYRGFGLSGGLVSGRVAYALGLEGPAVSVDTACSSSLVTLHLACQALRQGDCSLALAGGVTILSTPAGYVEFSRQRALAPDGRCKAFAARADGVGLSDGAGLLVLERLSDARRYGHRVLALVRGSAVNQDGASNGVAAPNGPSQERLIRQALASAGLGPADVDAVEAHGTGTRLGDPIEAQALLATYGVERAGAPLRMGSVKSNLGHAQAAAGVAGAIKMVLALRHGLLPKTLHVDAPSPHVDWSVGEVELLTEPVPWERGERPRRAAVSSFGISGTNAHVILEEAPPDAPPEAAPDVDGLPVAPVALSARSQPALRAQARQLYEHVAGRPDLAALDVAFSLATGRAQLERRAVVAASDRESLLAQLAALAEPGTAAPPRGAGKLALMFTGQGAQRPGLGAELAAAFPAFAQALDAVCAELDSHLDGPLQELVWAEGPAAAERLDRTELAQPALFAFEVAASRLLESCGVVPELLIGHSVGEIAAVHVAGGLSLADACRLVAARGRLMGALPPGGAMLAVEATESEARAELRRLDGRVSLAAVNAPRAVVVSGDADAVARLEALWRERGRRTRCLRVSHAFHSPRMEPMLDELRRVAAGLSFRPLAVPVVSNLSGRPLSEPELADPGYWARHAREAVRFADGVEALRAAGATRFVEVGPGGRLAAMARECLGDADALVVGAAREGRHEAEALVECLAALHVNGVDVDWQAVLAGRGARRVELPTYPFQRRRYWLAPALGRAGTGHPLLETALRVAGRDEWLLTGRLSAGAHPWLAEHAVHDTAVVPGSALVELALAAAARVGCEAVQELVLEAPLGLAAGEALELQLTVGPPDRGGRRELVIHARPEEPRADPEWRRHAVGVLAPAGEDADLALAGPWPPPGSEPREIDAVYDQLVELGVVHGPAFRCLRAAWTRGTEVLAELALDPARTVEAPGFELHPLLLDAALHAGVLGGDPARAGLPFAWSGVRLLGRGATSLRVRLTPASAGAFGLAAADERGEPVLSAASVAVRPADAAQLAAAGAPGRSLFGVEWDRVALPAPNGHAASLAAWQVPRRTDDDPAAAAHAAVAHALDELRRWLSGARSGEERLAVVTRGAVAVRPSEEVDPAAAAVWGLVRSAQAEHPGRFALVDVDGGEIPWAALAATSEPQLAVRGGAAWAPRLAHAGAPADGEPSAGGGAALAADGTVLITGGTGALGAALARHLAPRVARLELVSRQGLAADGAEALARELESLGCEVRVTACDAADRRALSRVLAAIPAERPLTAVFHAAGVLEDATVESLDPAALARVMRPKVDAAWHLHELTSGVRLSAFVLYSSAAGTLGPPGQAAYAAANAFLDGLALHRRARGLPAMALGWGAWSVAGGMTSGLREADQARIERMGARALAPEQGLALLDAALAHGRSQLVVARLDSAALARQAAAGMLPAIARGLLPGSAAGEPTVESLPRKLHESPPARRRAIVLEAVRAQAAAALGHPSPAAIDPERTFKELGFDSLAAVELRNRLARAAGVTVPATLVFDHPTASAIADYLYARLAGPETVDRGLDRAERPGGADPELEKLGDDELFALIDTELGQEESAA